MADGLGTPRGSELDQLRRYLTALVAARQGPVHVNTAFNALYFGYDVTGEGYGGSPLDLDDFPVVTLGGRIPALPVGAMVRIATGAYPLYAEIVYKEGRHRETSVLGDVPAWVSGAPAGAEGPGQVCQDDRPARREALIPDLEAFGDALRPTLAQLTRFRAQQRWLDQAGHLVVDAVYPSTEAAAQDESSAFVDYLLTEARAQLLSPAVPVPLPDLVGSQDEGAMRRGVQRLLHLIRTVLEAEGSLRSWGPYTMSRSELSGWLGAGGALGRDDMSTLASVLQRAVQPTVKRRFGMETAAARYTAIGPRLRSFDGADQLLAGTGYAAAVCRANLAIGDVIRGESENGLFENGIQVALDDAFEGGGVWRSHTPDAAGDCGSPLIPAGLGWDGTVQPEISRQTQPQPQPQPPTSVPEPPTVPLDIPLEDAELRTSEFLRITNSEIVWRLPLRLCHLMDDYLPLSRLVADELRTFGTGPVVVRVELSHPGGDLDDSETVQDTTAEFIGDSGRLNGITWPLDFFPGLQLYALWPRGGRVIRISTVPLEEPVLVDGHTIGHRYDAEVFTRENAPGSSRGGDSAAGLTSRDLVMRFIRRCGLLTPDGHALLDRAALPTAVYGMAPAAPQVAELAAAVEDLLAVGRLYRATGSRASDGRPHHPARPGEAKIPLVGYDPAPVPAPRNTTQDSSTPPQWSTTPITLHQVHGFLRRLGPSSVPSDAQRAAYRDHCRRLGKADGWELPGGFTFVTAHTRGR
ncbi:hypothetical protein [Kitasatospora sp. NBC_01266]|uniref:hypothetical protein n=1 Tax=Kitasatospora sp. NBC_01266 TaxID=2903572 RepID=UPI002E36BC1D|nr:hypothetical protein [Kitasatospora sp. NBC_01266]